VVAITLAEIGGAQAYVMALLPALVERFDVVVAAHGPGPLREAAESAGARYVALRWVRRSIGPSDVLGLLELARLFRRERADAVALNSSKVGLLGRVAAVLARVPVRVFTVHGWAFSAHTGMASKLYLWAERLVRPLTTLFICPAEHERDIGVRARACTPGRTVVIPNAVDVPAFARAGLDGNPPLVVSVGRLHFPKDFLTFVHALALLEPGSFRARIIGEGPDRDAVQAAVEEAGLGAAVELAGTRDDVPAQLAQADAFVLSSRSECLPISILEAMAAGLPVVATDVGGVGELVEEGNTGRLVAPGDPDAMAQGLTEVLADPSRRSAMGQAARARAGERFDLPLFREAHVEALDRLIGQPR
jgi:glycosyltransferase involved in cell wall biosynthesis